jgi:hypothetical protein
MLPATVLSSTAPTGVYYIRVLAQNGALASAPSTEIVVTVGGAVPRGGRPVSGTDLLFDEGVALFNQGRLVEARGRFVQLVAVDPQRAEAFYLIGLIDINRGDLAGARASWTQYLVLAPSGPQASEVRFALAQLR